MSIVLTEENYFSQEAEALYMGSTQYRNFAGTAGLTACESRALAMTRGEHKEMPTKAMRIGSYVDAYFSGTVDLFKAQNPDLIAKSGKNKGDLLEPFQEANELIERIKQDEYFLKTLSGGTQEILTGEMFGIDWKVKIDSYHKGQAIVDLKTTKSITDKSWTKDQGYVSFLYFYGYYTQLAIYQQIVAQNTDKVLPVLIAAISKEKNPEYKANDPEHKNKMLPNIEVILMDQGELDIALNNVQRNCFRIKQLKSGEVKPTRCGVCVYCRKIKTLTGPISSLGLS